MIKLNEKIPACELQHLIVGKSVSISCNELFTDKKVVLFAVPGAFTPTCSHAHLPGYIALEQHFKAQGIDTIICLSINDAFVMHAWGEAQNVGAIMMLADGDGAFTKALGLSMETGSFGGLRSQRYSMLVDNGIVTILNIEQPKSFEVSKADVILDALSK
jgi:peroxiredoxin